MSRRLCWHPTRVRILRVTSSLASAAQQEILTASPPSCFEKEVVSRSHSLSCSSFLSFSAAGQSETYFNACSHRRGWRLLRTIRPIREQLLTPKKHDRFFHSFAPFSEKVKVAGVGATKRKSVREGGRRETERERECESEREGCRQRQGNSFSQRTWVNGDCTGLRDCHSREEGVPEDLKDPVRWATDHGRER